MSKGSEIHLKYGLKEISEVKKILDTIATIKQDDYDKTKILLEKVLRLEERFKLVDK
jgi:hypothetical protein